MKILQKLLVFATFVNVLTALPITDYCERAATSCKFQFEGTCSIPTYSLDAPENTPFTPRIVSKSWNEITATVQSANISGEFLYSYYYLPLFARGLLPSQFRPFAVASQDGSAIGYEHFQVSKDLARNECVRVFFTSYQRQMFGSAHIENVNVTPEQARRDNLCVVFRTS